MYFNKPSFLKTRNMSNKIIFAILICFLLFLLIFLGLLIQTKTENIVVAATVTECPVLETINNVTDIEHVEVSNPVNPIEVTESTIVSIDKTPDNEDVAEPSKRDSSSNSSQSGGNPNTWDSYVGRFNIPSVGIDVGCYASNSQATVDASDSAAYYFGDGHYVIADHTNQGFDSIKYCTNGTKASFSTGSEMKEYTCVDKIQGHNTGYGLTDSSGNSIWDLYEGCLVCYTCNDNWQNVTIVFFQPDNGESAGVGNYYEEDEYGYYDDDGGSSVTMVSGGKEYIYDEETDEWYLDEDKANCEHSWSSWDFFCTGMNVRVCNKCGQDDYEIVRNNTDETEDYYENEDYESEDFDEEPVEPEDVAPVETEPVEETESWENPTEATENIFDEETEDSSSE